MSLWQLDPALNPTLYRQDQWVVEGAKVFKTWQGLTAHGNAAPLTIEESPSRAITDLETYVFVGGYMYQTSDPTVYNVWINSGFTVTTLIP